MIVEQSLSHSRPPLLEEIPPAYQPDVYPLLFVSAALAERLNITRLLTLDRRHFSIVRPRHCPAFDLIL